MLGSVRQIEFHGLHYIGASDRSSCTNIRMRGLTSAESRCVRELLRKLGDCDEGTQAMVPGAGETISGLQRRPVGHNGFGLGSWIREAWGGPPPMGR